MKEIAPLVTVVGLLFGGALTYAQSEVVTGVALLSAGLVTLGVWIAIEVKKRDDK